MICHLSLAVLVLLQTTFGELLLALLILDDSYNFQLSRIYMYGYIISLSISLCSAC